MPYGGHKVYLIMISLLLCISQGCNDVTATATSLPTAMYTMTLTATNTPKPTKMPTATSMPSITPTPVPLGVFALFFYTPLVMNYDPSIWADKSNYTEWGDNPIPPTVTILANYLQARKLATCKITMQGPTEFNEPYPYEIVHLGNIEYVVTTFKDSPPGFVAARYIENGSLIGYDYDHYGTPIPVIQASLSEREECKVLAEKVLSTLHVP